MKSGIIQSLKFLIFFTLGIVLLWFAFHKADLERFIIELKDANYSWLLLSVLFGFIAFVSRARRWVLIINPLGYNPSLKNSFYALMTGYLANLALPRIGEITRCLALGKKEKIPVDQLIGTVVVERTIDFLSLVSIMVLLIITSGDLIGEFLKVSIVIPVQQRLYTVFGVKGVLLVIFFVVAVVLLILMIRYRKKLRRFSFFSKLFDLARGIINGLKAISKLKRKWEFVFLTVFIWLNYALMTWVVVFAIESTSLLTFRDSIFILVIGGLAMSAPVQAGFGVFHYFVSQGLLFVKGIPIEDGLVYALLTHESQLIFVAIVGTISYFLIVRRDKTESTP